jgi:hypothetical protein
LIGVGDESSKRIRALSQAQENAVTRFKDCCAEHALVYHRELAERTGGSQQNDVYEWIARLSKPPKSKEYREAKDDADKILMVLSGINQLQFQLRIAAIKRGPSR